MESIYLFLIFAIGVILAIGVGLQISEGIDDFLIKFLFWLIYIISIITFINIILVGNYYLSMKDKTGPPGLPGDQGDRGDSGEVGKCDPKCRDSICTDQITELLISELQARNQGVAVRMNNVYIKSKIKQMCESDEFRQLAPYNGPINLINYIKDIWRIWIDLLYNAGGSLYFENIGAEDNFDWQANNPFDEMKKYDIFYWGMGKQYRPRIIDKCYNSINGVSPVGGNDSGSILHVSKTDLYDPITNDQFSGSYQRVSFWRAKQFTYKGAVFYPVGDIAIGPTRTGDNTRSRKRIGMIRYPYESTGPARETIIVSGDVRGPVNYDLLWTNYGWSSRNRRKPTLFWVWRPIAPVGYIALGDVITTTADPPETGNNAPIRCVPLDLTVRLPANGAVLWSSNGSQVGSNLNLLGFVANTNGGYSSSADNNAYNLFRGVVGYNTAIPESDINGNFYYIDPAKYDTTFEIGKDNGVPDMGNDANRVGKGYLPSEKRDSKYSVIAYLNLKNAPVLRHNKTGIEITGQLIPNAISNCYILKVGEKCLNYTGSAITLATCDEMRDSQYFSIQFNGIIRNQCTIKHIQTGKTVIYKTGIFMLSSSPTTDEEEYTLFTMS